MNNVKFLENVENHFDEASKNYDKYKYRKNFVNNVFFVRQTLVQQFIEEQNNKDLSILDCGCGTGEIVIELAKKGYNINGFDISNNMVRVTKDKLQKNNIKNVHIWKDNVCSFKVNKKYDVIIAAGVFQYFNKTLQKKAYQNIKKALKPNGLLITSYGNSIFSLFTFNKFTVDFFTEYIFSLHFYSDKKSTLTKYVSSLLTQPMLGRKEGTKAETALGYIPVYLTNPFTIKEELQLNGFDYQNIKFFHFHALPPSMKDLLSNPKEFDINSESMEYKFAESWFGYFMAYQFLAFSRLRSKQ